MRTYRRQRHRIGWNSNCKSGNCRRVFSPVVYDIVVIRVRRASQLRRGVSCNTCANPHRSLPQRQALDARGTTARAAEAQSYDGDHGAGFRCACCRPGLTKRCTLQRRSGARRMLYGCRDFEAHASNPIVIPALPANACRKARTSRVGPASDGLMVWRGVSRAERACSPASCIAQWHDPA